MTEAKRLAVVERARQERKRGDAEEQRRWKH
jgi:hypothetical protein